MEESFRLKQSICGKRTAALKKNPTESELIFKDRLTKSGIRFMFQKGFIQGNNFCIADFYIPKRKIVIEIDGEYHNSESQKNRDLNKDFYYRQRGFKVIRIKNSEVKTFPLSFVI